jgi:cytochrome P450
MTYLEDNSIYGPVKDWATDFDHADPEYNKNAHAIWDELRGTCPVAHTQRYGGTWLPTTHDLVHEIAYDTDHFSSRGVVVATVKPSDNPDAPPAPIGGAPPITSDPPFHQHARKILLPAFAPTVINEWEPEVRRLCRDLIENMGSLDVVDAAVQYAQHIPVNVIARMLGFPPEDGELFRGFVHNVLEAINLEPGARIQAFQELDAYISKQVQDHIENPRDDLTSFLLNATIFDNPLSPQHVGGTIILLLIAGIDTTWSAIGSSLWHLATNPVDRRRLVDNPALMPMAIEEFLRAYAPVTMARVVKEDYNFHGVDMKQNDWVLLPFPAANRDPAEWDDADKVIIDREVNRHAAFGLGIHRCLGSNLARLELRVAVEEFLAAYPDFELAPDEVVKWSVGQIRGPRELPVRITGRAN